MRATAHNSELPLKNAGESVYFLLCVPVTWLSLTVPASEKAKQT